jgi:hypothetical protein
MASTPAVQVDAELLVVKLQNVKHSLGDVSCCLIASKVNHDQEFSYWIAAVSELPSRPESS